MMPHVLLVEDHPVVRAGLRSLLESRGLQVVGEADDGRQAVEMARELRPDVCVLDLVMPRLNGLDAAREIARESPRTRSIVLTAHGEDEYVLHALRTNVVRGYVLKTQAADDLVTAIHEVCAGALYVSPAIAETVVDAFREKRDLPAEPLTPRQREVLQLIAEGRTTKEVAAELNISVKTAETHRTRIMNLLDIHETANLVRYAIRRGLVEP